MKPLRLLIAFEGIDGAGKWTQAQKVRDWIQHLLNQTVTFSSEPNDDADSGTPLGKTIRKMLKGELAKPKDPYEFQRLYVLQRGEDVACFIRPYFERRAEKELPAIYFMERYALSTVAYGMLSERPAEDFIQLHNSVIGPQMIWPDLTVLLDLPAKEAIRRISKGRNHGEFFEKERVLKRVRSNYLKARYIGPFKDRTVVVAAERPEDAVFEDVKAAIMPLLTPSS